MNESDKGSPETLLDEFGESLISEREAVLAGDVAALGHASVKKRNVLDRISQINQSEWTSTASQSRLSSLVELNRDNGELIARRARHVEWALSRLGRQIPSPEYGPNGRIEESPRSRAFGSV
jgi:hypothetical protein